MNEYRKSKLPAVDNTNLLPLVSVVMVNYNHGHYLSDSLQSVYAQDYPRVECVVQDGCSTDNSAQVASHYANVLWESREDLGNAHAFARSALRSTGDYLSLMTSSDSYSDPSWLTKAVEVLEKKPHVSMVVGGVKGINALGLDADYFWPLDLTKKLNPEENFFDWLFCGNGFTPISIVIRRGVFFETFPHLEEVGRPNQETKFDYFWKFSENFFSSGYISIRLPIIAAKVRLHDDRIDDISYLGTQQARLDYHIRNFRTKLVLGQEKYFFRWPTREIYCKLSYSKLLLRSFYTLSRRLLRGFKHE